MVVNYREQPVGPLLSFLAFILICLIGLPLWAGRHFGAPQNFPAGKLVLLLVMGVLYLILVVRTFMFNARVRRDPRALQWDERGLSLWSGARAETLSWPQVRQISIKLGRSASNLSFLTIVTGAPGGEVSRWTFSSGRLRLAGQSLPDIALQLEQARTGQKVTAVTPPDRQAANARYNERLAATRGIVAIVMSVYVITLVGMLVYLSSSRTTLLTPRDPLLWRCAVIGFFGTACAILLWYVKTIADNAPISRRVALWFLCRIIVPGLFFAAMIGGWAYLAANVYVTARTFGGDDVQHGAVLLAVEPGGSYSGRPIVHAHLINRPGRDVIFTIDDADANLLRHWHDPGYIDEPACVTVPVEWVGYAIRAEASPDTPLPRGSISACS